MKKKGTRILIVGSLVLLLGFAGLAELLSLPMKAVMTGSVLGVGVTFIGYFIHCWAMTRPFSLQMKILGGGVLVRLAIFVLVAGLLHKKMGWPIAPLVFPMIAAYVLSTLIEGVSLGLFNRKVTPVGSRTSEKANGG
jgi:hypothetical protein